MCLGDLGEVLEVDAPRAVVRAGERIVTVSLLTLDEPVCRGDWVLCHSGYALSRLTPEEAREAEAIRRGEPTGNPTATDTEVEP
jgi:hydrogenase expression/formation protein HypC